METLQLKKERNELNNENASLKMQLKYYENDLKQRDVTIQALVAKDLAE